MSFCYIKNGKMIEFRLVLAKFSCLGQIALRYLLKFP